MKVVLWIRSGRGTNSRKIISFNRRWVKNNYGTIKYYVEQKLEEWCETFGCWHTSENFVRYGWYKKVN